MDLNGMNLGTDTRQRIGPPRLNPEIRLLHRFYEPLILLKILDPTRGRVDTHLSSDTEAGGQYSLWCSFLDHLSWMCYYKRGGDTVSAIAVEGTTDGPIFWLAANKTPGANVRIHLEWILRQLETPSEEGREGIARDILMRCLDFSKDKVKGYTLELCRRIEACTLLVGESIDGSDLELVEDLRALSAKRAEPFELCSAAYHFRHSTSMERIVEKQSMLSGSSSWSELRHYIGRLGSWEKSRNILVGAAARYQHLIAGFRVSHLKSQRPISGPAPDSHTNLDGALRRMLPANESSRLQEIQEAVRDNRAIDLSSEFVSAYDMETFKPRVHAELLVLEHFYHNDLEFSNHERYIGCSKPSCYCCDLYMKCHPGTFINRATHGNLWINWRPPTAPASLGVAADKHTRDILNEMVKHIRKAALDQIRSRLPRRQRLPDSSTGISASLH